MGNILRNIWKFGKLVQHLLRGGEWPGQRQGAAGPAALRAQRRAGRAPQPGGGPRGRGGRAAAAAAALTAAAEDEDNCEDTEDTNE